MSEVIRSIFTVENILMINIGLAAGVLIGAMPGLSVSFAVTMMLTMTYHMDTLPAMFLMLGSYCGGMYGGSITAILINTPGTANAVCTALDGYPLARQGRAGEAMRAALLGSTIGGLVSAFALMYFAPQLAKIIMKIGSAEYFSLCVFGLVAAISLECKSMNDLFKGMLSAAFGLLLSCVGADPVFGTNRFSFGSYYMMSGIKVVSSMLGAYAMCQVLVNSREVISKGDESLKVPPVEGFNMKLKDFFIHWKTIIKSALIGTFIGAVPGCGGETSAMLAYNEAKRVSKHPDEFGKGSIEGVIAAETANNATTGGAMIPMLTLGVPGDAIMAILLSALTMQGITPGASLFSSGSFWVYAIMGGLIVINIFMLVQGLVFAKGFTQVTRVPMSLMTPCIVILCVMGSFAINNNIFECFVMAAFGLIGYFMKRYEFPITPLCIALVLGGIAERNLRRSLILSKGSWAIFVTRPVSLLIVLLSVAILLLPIIRKELEKKKAKKAEK